MTGKTAPFKLRRGFAFIRSEDSKQGFGTGDYRMDRVTLRDYYDRSRDPDRYVIVYKVRGRIFGVMEIELRPGHVYIANLARNVPVATGSVGGRLVRLAESIGYETGRAEVRLDSLDTAVKFYDEKMEYEEYAAPFFEEGWGTLTPKMKRLVPLPALGST